MRSLGVVGIVLVLSAVATANEVKLTGDDLAFLSGKWAGSLEYLDYKDNRTKTKLEASLAWSAEKGAIRYKFSYKEPGGKKVEGDATAVKLTDDGAKVKFNEEEWRVAKKAIDARAGKYEIVLTREGTDNKKAATLRRSIVREKDRLTIRTEVEVKKEKPFVRNEYVLTRQ